MKNGFAPEPFDAAPIGPGARGGGKGRLAFGSLALRLVVGYALFASGSFAMEGCARARFQVPSKADVAAVADPKDRIRAELVRYNRHEQMTSWPPYVALTVGTLLLGALGSIAAAVWIFRAMWRRQGELGVFHIKAIALAVMFSVCGIVLAAVAPLLVAEKYFEARPSGFAFPSRPAAAAPSPAEAVTPAARAGAQ